MSQGNQDKWENYSFKYNEIDSLKIATAEITAKITAKLLKDKKKDLILDIGCGFGLIDIFLAQKMSHNLIICDISEIALDQAKKNIKAAGLENRIKIEKKDVYNLDYPDNYFDVVLSFGYASAATYPGVQQEVHRILKPNGILIIDFINHLSLYRLLFSPLRIWKDFLEYCQKKSYYFGILGIKKYFYSQKFKFIKRLYFNTYPPVLRNFFSPRFYILFEKTIGRIFRNILGRVVLVFFQKID